MSSPRNDAGIPFMRYALEIQEPNGAAGLTMTDLDGMAGSDFEIACAYLLLCAGFRDVDVTPATGDYGVDITAFKDGCTYAVQCKRSESVIGNAAVQQVHAGKAMYHADRAIVMTNSDFTRNAAKLARETGVGLWNRDVLSWLLSQA